jgi:hypothetical protein
MAEECSHSPFAASNSLIVESHWALGVRIRCGICGKTADVGKKGVVTPCEPSSPDSAGESNGP